MRPSCCPPIERKQRNVKTAYVHGQFADAIELGKQLVDEDHEKGTWNELEPTGKKLIEYVCQRNETPLPEITPAM